MSTFYYFIGIDVSKDDFQTAIFDLDNNLIASKLFEMNNNGFENFKTLLNSLDNNKIAIAMESTGIYHINLLSFLTSIVPNVALINPFLIKNFSASNSLRKTKTDLIDANTIAKYLRKNLDCITFFNTNEHQHLTNISRRRENIINLASKTKTQLKQNFNIVFPELVKSFNIFSQFFLEFFNHFISPKDVIEASRRKLVTIFNKITSGRGKKPSFSIDDIINLAKSSIGISNPHNVWVIKSIIRQLKFLLEEIQEINVLLTDEVKKAFPQTFEIITSVKGVGESTASQLIAEIKDFSRFSTYKKLIAFAGTDPSISQSGKSNKKGKISKRGSSHLRRLAFIIASSLARNNKLFKEYYKKKTNENMPYRKAIIAVWNKFLRIIFTLIKNNTKFQEELN